MKLKNKMEVVFVGHLLYVSDTHPDYPGAIEKYRCFLRDSEALPEQKQW